MKTILEVKKDMVKPQTKEATHLLHLKQMGYGVWAEKGKMKILVTL